eukprot:6287264-Prymnesium_polylepis.1
MTHGPARGHKWSRIENATSGSLPRRRVFAPTDLGSSRVDIPGPCLSARQDRRSIGAKTQRREGYPVFHTISVHDVHVHVHACACMCMHVHVVEGDWAIACPYFTHTRLLKQLPKIDHPRRRIHAPAPPPLASARPSSKRTQASTIAAPASGPSMLDVTFLVS